MNSYDFIFSQKKSHRLRRHLVFWLLWFLYFAASYFHYQQTGLEKAEFELWNLPFLIKTSLLLVLHILACYVFTDYLMPRYLFTKRYVPLVLGALVLAFGLLGISYYFHSSLFPVVNAVFDYNPVLTNNNIWWTSIVSGLLSAPKVISAAAAIKLLKRWYMKQKEKERLEKEKLITDLRLLKGQVHPDFLFSSLTNICRLTEKKETGKASGLLLKLADMLSYMIYESDNSKVPLEKEIKMIKDYLLLEKIGRGKLELDIAVKGVPNDMMITPMLLFPLIENSFRYISGKNHETSWMNLEFQMDQADLVMKIIHGKTAEALPGTAGENAMANIRKRLEFFYRGSYELKTTIEPEIMMIYLKIRLMDAPDKKINDPHTEESKVYVTA